MDPVALQGDVVGESLEALVGTLVAAIPTVVSGIIFLVFAAVLVKLLTLALRAALARAIPDESAVYRQFVVAVAGTFLWFAVALTFLSIVGLEGIAASLGTAAGFLALGISYALSGMIADAVAGIYLLRDPDFEVGDTVTAGDVTGEVRAIELRKTRLRVEEDTVVRANSEIEKKWTKRAD